jgi:hypothetical protein
VYLEGASLGINCRNSDDEDIYFSFDYIYTYIFKKQYTKI